MLRRLAMLLMTACCGCSTVAVYKQVGSRNERQPGIPFYVKRLVVVQTTKRRIDEARIRFVLKDPSAQKDASFLLSGPIAVPLNACSEEAIRSARDAILKTGSDRLENLETAIRKHQAEIEKCANQPARQVVVANSWKVTTVVDPTPYYLSPKRPVIGSTTVSAELASDGTLTKASVAVQDDTLSTLVPLLPVTKYFERVLGLDPVADKELIALSNEGAKGIASGRSRTGLKLSMEVSLQPTVYTLQKQHDYSDRSGASCRPPLSLLAAADGRLEPPNDVQLVSVESSPTPKKGDENAYLVSGSITPPSGTAEEGQ